ncbi:hypothetical protein DUI87_18941 [Hirundo rustica rustica]|uniref:ribonuclease H n=1 Tax=Hirundo rustica rustica TaxID=333673 RepID=A0A3M0JU04_HIRRU|nr:hypothetical protein DUI87_18941 [Hirundo rustica rustica]
MVNSPTICQITVDQALEPVQRSDPNMTIVQYMDDILIAAPSASQDWIIGRPRDAYTPVLEESDEPPSNATAPKNPAPLGFPKIGDSSLYQTYWCPASNPVLIVPRVLYHPEEEMYRSLEETAQLHKGEVITGITIAMLLGLGATGAATGVSALMTQHQRLSQLQMTINEDLLRIEKSISSLERSISSLSEVVLQNRVKSPQEQIQNIVICSHIVKKVNPSTAKTSTIWYGNDGIGLWCRELAMKWNIFFFSSFINSAIPDRNTNLEELNSGSSMLPGKG